MNELIFNSRMNLDIEITKIINWLIGGIFTIALLIQVCFYSNSRRLSGITLILFTIGNLLSFSQGIIYNDISLYLPSGIQSGCIIWIMSKYYMKQCDSSRREEEFIGRSLYIQEEDGESIQ